MVSLRHYYCRNRKHFIYLFDLFDSLQQSHSYIVASNIGSGKVYTSELCRFFLYVVLNDGRF